MELVSIIRQLWRRKLLVFLVFLVAVFVATWSAYKVPSMEKRGLQLGAASSQILVDSPASTLVEGVDANQLTTLATRARVYAQYLASLQARDEIAQASGIPARFIRVSGPFSSDVARNNYSNQSSESRAGDVLKEGAGYRLVFDAQEGVPIITVSAQAPTADAAVKLAKASFVALNAYVDKLQKEADAIPEKPLPKGAVPQISTDNGVRVRELGEPEGGTIGGGNGKILMVFVFLAVMLFGCALIAILPGMARHWRLLDRAEALVEESAEGPMQSPAPVVGDDPLRFGGRGPLRLDNGNGHPAAADEPPHPEEAPRRTSAWR
jgi:hypothetical protein